MFLTCFFLSFNKMAFVFNEDGPSLNVFMDICKEFTDSFADSRRFQRVAQTIVNILMENRQLHYLSDQHPFNRFGDSARTRRENLEMLMASVLARTQERALRLIVPSFFSLNGSCREDLDEVVDAFFDFVDESLDDYEDEEESVGNEQAIEVA